MESKELTWEDVQLLDSFVLDLEREERNGVDWGDSEKFYTEVLRRYNEFMEKTLPEIVEKEVAYRLNNYKK